VRRGALAAVAATGALAATGCGGHTATKQDVVVRADAICSNALRDIRATPSPAGGATALPALAAYLRTVVPILRREASDLKALPRPAAHRVLLNQYLAAIGSSSATYRALAAAAARGDQAAVNQALARLQVNRAPALAARYGLRQCVGAAGTAVPR
jgi:hypothetical protein